MMAELEIDQSNLPRVQEVRQCFAVLEDGVLAHNLQEQEIEQYYTTNIQKNQLVQNDIRVAKRLQDEEEEHQVQQRDSLRHASRQIEEQDFEYARVIQEELQRCAEEARRREEDDEELAKRMQEEEEQIVRRRSRVPEDQGEGNTSESAPQNPHRHSLGDERYPSTTTRWQCSTSHSYADLTGARTQSPRRAAAQENTTSWSNQGHTDSIRQYRSESRESPSEDSDDSDSVFAQELSVTYQRLCERFRNTPHQQQEPLHQSQERHHGSLRPRSSHADQGRGWEEEEHRENRELQRRRPGTRDWERSHSEENGERSGSVDDDSSLVEFADRWCRRSKSVRLPDRSRRSRDLTRTWSYQDNPDKHVHFRDDNRSSHRHRDESSQVWKMLGHILLERGVPVRFGGSRAPLQIGPQSRDSQVLHGSEVSCSDSRPHQRDFQRAATTRHSFHGDIRERRRLSYRENSGRDHREDRDRRHDNGEVYEISRRDSYLAGRERRGSRRWEEQRCADNGERNARDYRVRRTTSERRPVLRAAEERLNSEEEREVERRAEPSRRRALQHSQSFSSSSSSSSSRASTRRRSRRVAAGALLQPEPNNTSLNLGDLQQVLEDEELARQLQEEEDGLLSRNSQPSPRRSYPDGDFRVAQVAQDEEIARFIQKQEIKSKRLSRELEGPASWREHRAMISHHDRRAARERHVPRERLDSEGLPSPTEDCPPENQPPSPVSTTPQTQQIRNIAEELDPTFQARRPDPDGLQVAPTGPACQSSLTSDFVEEPTFIPPTKRQADKPGRSKAKEKKENCKQQ